MTILQILKYLFDIFSIIYIYVNIFIVRTSQGGCLANINTIKHHEIVSNQFFIFPLNNILPQINK